jgi:hypothetical protein
MRSSRGLEKRGFGSVLVEGVLTATGMMIVPFPLLWGMTKLPIP